MDDTSWSDNVTLFVEATQPILQHAYDRGVMVLLEPHPKQVLYDPMSTRAVLRALPDSAPVKLCLDVANVAALGFSPVSLTRGWGGALAAVHVKDLQTWALVGAVTGQGLRFASEPWERATCHGLKSLTHWLMKVSTGSFTSRMRMPPAPGDSAS